MNKIKRFIYSRRFIVAIVAILQLILFFVLTEKLYTMGATIYVLLTLFSAFVMLYLLEKDDMNPSYKIFWMIDMIVFPISGAIIYFFYGNTKLTKKQRVKMNGVVQRMKEHIGLTKPEIMEDIGKIDANMQKQAQYLENTASALAYKNTAVKYYPMGAALFRDYLKDIKNAKESIFIQYFIIDEGFMWDTVHEVLKEKVKEGVDVRVIYDGWGCLMNLPVDYEKQLREEGIKAYIFNDVKFSVHLGDYLMLNHRDHRKITVIDSTIAYTGGINLADEYINVIERFGVWKDTGFRIEGDAVWGLTTTFMNAWECVTFEVPEYEKFRPRYSCETDGIVQPYFDTPLDKENVCENTYLSVINNAKKYVYLATPYLVVDNEFLTALKLAAKSGVDVRIIVPGIPDKWYVYYVTQSYYKVLIEAGVKIYEYTPGFIHAKMYVTDDKQAIVGGANTDFRSMYLNFENACSFYGGSIVKDVKADFEDTLKHSRQVTMEDIKNTNVVKRMLQIVFRLFGPLM